MSFAGLGKKLGTMVMSGPGRLVALLMVPLCFYLLILVGHWSKSYAASEAWAVRAAREGLEWSPIVSAAARAMAKQEPQTYPTPESFYQALSAHIKGEGGADVVRPRLGKDDWKSLAEYREIRKQRDTTLKELQAFWDRWSADSNATMAELAKKYSSKEEAEYSLVSLNVESLERTHREMARQRVLADRETRIKSDEEGIRAAFDAALPSARPVGRLPSRLQGFTTQVGDETDPLHILFLLTWYGLEGLIVVLLCIVIVPWLIRVGGGTADLESWRAKLVAGIKNLIAKGFGERAAAGIGKAVLAVVAGSLALVGVAKAAGDQPSIAPLLPPRTVAVAGAQGEPGAPGHDGVDGVNADSTELSKRLDEQEKELARQAARIEVLLGTLGGVSRRTEENREHVEAVVREAAIVAANLEGLSAGMGSLTSDVSMINDSVGGLSAAQRSLLRASSAANLHLADSLVCLGQTTAAMANDMVEVKSNVETVKTKVEEGARDLPPTAGDVIRLSGLPRGFLPGVNPFYRYQVTPAVVATMTRAMQGLAEAEKERIVAALGEVQQQDNPLKIWKFRDELQGACKGCDPAVLRPLLPLIEKLSRVK